MKITVLTDMETIMQMCTVGFLRKGWLAGLQARVPFAIGLLFATVSSFCPLGYAQPAASLTIRIERLGDGLWLQAPPDISNLVVECSTNLAPNSWVDVPLVVDPDTGFAFTETSGPGRFFRLRLPAAAPQILTQPAPSARALGQSVVFSVTALGDALSYQWFHNTTNLLSGATGPSLSLSNLQPAEAGAYSVLITNAQGLVWSEPARLEVVDFSPLLDNVELSWSMGGSPGWRGQTNVTMDGVDAAQSGAIFDSQETWFEALVNGPGTVSFWWKVSSEQNYDFLEFYVSGDRVSRISGEGDWQPFAYSIPAGAQTLRWRYTKDASSRVGRDAGWVDQVGWVPENGLPLVLAQPTNNSAWTGTDASFNVAAAGGELTYQWFFQGTNLLAGATNACLVLTNVQLTNAGHYSVKVSNANGTVSSQAAQLTILNLSQYLNAPNLVWTMGGDASWFGQTADSQDGNGAARSGAISASQESWLETTVNGPGTLSFYWKVSSESNFDLLEFYINGVLQPNYISDEMDWELQSVVLPAGPQTLRWRYTKDTAVSVGQDCGWLDRVSFVPGN